MSAHTADCFCHRDTTSFCCLPLFLREGVGDDDGVVFADADDGGDDDDTGDSCCGVGCRSCCNVVSSSCCFSSLSC